MYYAIASMLDIEDPNMSINTVLHANISHDFEIVICLSKHMTSRRFINDRIKVTITPTCFACTSDVVPHCDILDWNAHTPLGFKYDCKLIDLINSSSVSKNPELIKFINSTMSKL